VFYFFFLFVLSDYECNCIGIIVDASAGITHLHEEGVIHRDISCRNFLLDDHLRAYVADFGLSQYLPKNQLFGVSEPGEMVPLKWMAPEAVTHRHFSHATDTYMFGMFMYEFFARVAPFRMELPGAPNSVLAKAIQAGQRPDLPVSSSSPPSLLYACGVYLCVVCVCLFVCVCVCVCVCV